MQAVATTTGTEEFTLGQIEATIPWMDTGAYAAQQVSVRITRRQARALRMMMDGVTYEGGEIETSGRNRPVRSHHDTVRWILDRAADALGI